MSVWRLILAGMMFFAAAGVCMADDRTPEVLVKQTVQEVLDVIKQDKDIQQGNNKKVRELVESKVLPNFNFKHMTALAVGRSWNKASPQQQDQLASEFRDLLVFTYSSALANYRNQQVNYKPFKAKPGETDVVIKSVISQPGKEGIPIDYALEKLADGWKVYDIVVSGVSLVTNYRETFLGEIRSGGIDGLIKSLVSKNRALEQQMASKADKR